MEQATSEILDGIRKGRAARLEGWESKMNPFVHKTQLANAWAAGWTFADMEIAEKELAKW